ncbi:FGGY-family carbohydrate kinase [bacterium]|nr:FGGY-family carbohydrate kinase [bacterium]
MKQNGVIHFLGIDLGTAAVKALVTRPDGSVVARGTAPVALFHPAGGGVEQDIEEIWAATLRAAGDALAGCDAASIRAIGVSSQGGALQVLDAAGGPCGPVISWLDGRGAEYDRAVNDELGRAWFVKRTGHAGSSMSIGQILRLRAEGVLRPDSRIGFVGDQVVKRLCGVAAHDATSLSLAMLYNPAKRMADPDVLSRLQIAEAQLPALLAPRATAGRLLDGPAQHLGLPPGLPVSPAIHDQYTAALGATALSPGDVMVGTGTAWVLLAASGELAPPVTGGAFVCTHVLDGMYGQIISLRNGGSSIAWARDALGLGSLGIAECDALIDAIPPGSDGVRFWPFLAGSGEGLPGDTAGRFTGLRLAHTAPHLLRAVIEGLSCELARYMRRATDAGLPLTRVVLCGGATRSTVTPRIIAAVTGLDVSCVNESDTSALGAAIIARGLVEPGTSLASLATSMKPDVRAVDPGAHHIEYRELFDEYLESLPARKR